MKPASAIAALERQLSAKGPAVTMRREKGKSVLVATVRGFVRGAKPEELAPGVSQDARSVVLSPTGFAAWQPLPMKGDLCRVGEDAFAQVVSAEIVRMNDVPVRINLIVEVMT